jgi:hypothetical protein
MAAKALKEQKKAHEDVESAMQKQIAAATTLKEKHEAMAKAIQNTKDAQEAYNQALAEQAAADSSTMNSVKSKIGGWFDKDWGHDKAAAAKVAEAQRALIASKRTEKAARDKANSGGKYLSVERVQANIGVARANAMVAGNQQSVVRLGNLENFSQNYERMRGIYGDKAAKDKALALSSGQIAEQAAAPAASSLAKIGLGGEFGTGADVQKQIRDLTKDVAEYLRSIDAKMTGGGIPANTPAEYDGT